MKLLIHCQDFNLISSLIVIIIMCNRDTENRADICIPVLAHFAVAIISNEYAQKTVASHIFILEVKP